MCGFHWIVCVCCLSQVAEKGALATVIDISEKEDRIPRPQALNTVSMLKLASQCLGMGPQQAMQVGCFFRGLCLYRNAIDGRCIFTLSGVNIHQPRLANDDMQQTRSLHVSYAYVRAAGG